MTERNDLSSNDSFKSGGVLPTTANDLFRHLDKLRILYRLYQHDPVFTVAESSTMEKDIPGVHCRNLFLRDKKKKMFLVVAANETQVDMKKLAGIIGSDRLSFGSADRLWEFLGVRPGSVCPFAAINDKDKQVKVILDKHMMGGKIVNYHPLENHMTVGLTPGELLRFFESINIKPEIIDLSPAAPDQE